MGTWGGNILSQTKLCGTKSGDTAAITVGNAAIATINYTGTATIDSEITAVADIDDPAGGAGWTDLVDLTGGPYLITTLAATNVLVLCITVRPEEDSGDSLRLQVLKDGDIVWDAKAVGDGAFFQSVRCFGSPVTNTYLIPFVGNSMYCETSFKIRVARKGDFTAGSSVVSVAGIQYNEVEKL